MPVVDVGRYLPGEQVLANRRRKGAILGRKQPQRVDGLLRILLRPLVGDEVKELVLEDRTAEAAAVLIAAIRLLVENVAELSPSRSGR